MFLTLNFAVCNRESILIIILHARVSTLKEELKGEIQSVKSELSEATKSLSAVWEEVLSLEQKNKDLQDQWTALQTTKSRQSQEKGHHVIRAHVQI